MRVGEVTALEGNAQGGTTSTDCGNVWGRSLKLYNEKRVPRGFLSLCVSVSIDTKAHFPNQYSFIEQRSTGKNKHFPAKNKRGKNYTKPRNNNFKKALNIKKRDIHSIVSTVHLPPGHAPPFSQIASDYVFFSTPATISGVDGLLRGTKHTACIPQHMQQHTT